MRCLRKCLYLIACVLFCAIFLGCGLFVDVIPEGQMIGQTARDRFTTIDGVRYHYTEYPAPGRDVLLIHGFASSTYTWEKVAPSLQQRGYHVWALDMKGFGWSDKPGDAVYDPVTLTEEVRKWMDAVGLKNAVLAGNSLGGGVAWLMALLHPDKVHSLILVDAAAYPIKMPFIMSLADLPLSAGLTKLCFSRWIVRRGLLEVYHYKDRITNEQVGAYYDRLRTKNALDAQISVVKALDLTKYEKYIGRIPEIKTRTLIIWGENDRWIPLHVGQRLNKELPASTLAVIPSCGHIPQEEYPDETAQLMAEFIAAGPLENIIQ
jgi:pimeloyl-ACP methyl ester carboxylesterase